MIKLFLSILFFSFSYSVQSQKATVAHDKMNILWVGIDNAVSFAMENTSCAIVEVSASNASVMRGKSCYLLVKPLNEGVVNIVLKKKGTNKVMVFPFRAKRIDNLIKVSIPNYDNDSIAKNKLLSFGKLEASPHNSEYDFNLKIISFETRLVKQADSSVVKLLNNGAAFSEQLKNEIAKLTAGDEIYFEKIKILKPDNDHVEKSLKIVIKN